MGAAGPEDLADLAGEVAGEVPKGGKVLRVVPVGVGSVTEASGPEFQEGKQAVDVRHIFSNLQSEIANQKYVPSVRHAPHSRRNWHSGTAVMGNALVVTLRITARALWASQNSQVP